MKKRKVRVEIPGKLIYFQNRKIRTPFTLELADNDLEKFKFALHAAGVEEYSVHEIKETDDVDEEPIIIPQKEEVVIEDLNVEDMVEPKTILEKLLKDENGE